MPLAQRLPALPHLFFLLLAVKVVTIRLLAQLEHDFESPHFLGIGSDQMVSFVIRRRMLFKNNLIRSGDSLGIAATTEVFSGRSAAVLDFLPTGNANGSLMKRLAWVVLVAFLSVAATAKADATAYVVTHGGQFGIVDLSSGAITSIGPSGVPYEGLALSPGGTVYGSANSGTIYSVNPTTGAATAVGNGAPVAPLAIRFDPADTLYAINAQGAVTNLYMANSPSGAFSLVGSTGVSDYWDDLAFIDPNTLLMEANPGGGVSSLSSLYSINTTTGAASLIGPTGYTVAPMVFEDGTLYGFDPNTDQILSINTSTGLGSPIVNYDSSFGTIYGAAELVYSVPEPGSISLLVFGMVPLLLRRRRFARL